MADCTSPAAPESKTIWDFTNHVMKTCDGTNWLSMAGGSSSGTAGYIQFSDGSGGFSSDGTANGQLYWNNTTHALGIGTTSPEAPLDVLGSAVVQHFWLDNKQAPATRQSWGLVVSHSTGNFNVGYRTDDTPGSDTLHVVPFRIKVAAPVDTLVLDSGGNVGIGTGTPRARLDVIGNAIVKHFWLDNKLAPATRQSWGFVIGNATGDFNLGYRTDDTPGSGSLTTAPFQIKAGTPGDRLVLDSTGNVGIGTTTPNRPLEVAATGTHSVIRTAATGNGSVSGIEFFRDTSTGLKGGGFIRVTSDTAGTTGKLEFGACTNCGANTGSTQVVVDGPTGNVGVGTTTPAEKLSVNGNVVATTYLYSSDRRLKADITPLLDQLQKVNALEPVSYTLKADEGHAKRLGLIAQDVETIYPEIVHGKGDAMKAIDYASLVAPLIAAVKELKAANDNLAARVDIPRSADVVGG